LLVGAGVLKRVRVAQSVDSGEMDSVTAAKRRRAKRGRRPREDERLWLGRETPSAWERQVIDDSDSDPVDQTGDEPPGGATPDRRRDGRGDATASDRLATGGGVGTEAETDAEPRISFYGGKWASTIPLAFCIAWGIFQSGVLRIGGPDGLVIGALVGTILRLFFARGDWKAYAGTIFEGMNASRASTALRHT
jgi:hypothetical protein